MRRRLEAGSGLPAALLLLLVLVGAGAWNYQRNLQLEQAEYRPYRGYTDEAIDQMIEAYEGKRSRDSARYERTSTRRPSVQGKAYFDEQVQEFERVQGASAAKKAARLELAESQAGLKLLEAEKRKRARERDRLKLFFRRLTTL